MTQDAATAPPRSDRSSLRIASGWPQTLPLFVPLPATEELRVPLASRMVTDFPAAVQGSVRQGERLVEHAPESSHLPIVPVDAIVEAELSISLLDGRRLPAKRLILTETEPPRPSASPTAPENPPGQTTTGTAGLAEVQTSDLGVWIDRLRDGGIWADRWTSPDLLGQLNSCLKRPIDTVICNLLDVDPTVPLNAALAANYPDELLAGLTVLGRITAAARSWIVTDVAAPSDWSGSLRAPSPQGPAPAGLRVVPLVNVYPQADPSLLLYALLNRRLRPGRLPAELGVLVLDAAAAIAVGRLALSGKPMLTLPVAVRDHARSKSHFRTVAIGTPLVHILRSLGLPPIGQLVVRGGDVLRDIHLGEESVVGGTELLVHASPLEPPINPDPCIRCGWCFESCPTFVQPANCLEAAQRDDADLAMRFGIEGCIDCGICSYVCPSHLPILTGIRWMRSRLEG